MTEGLYNDLKVFFQFERSAVVDADELTLADTFAIWAFIICDLLESKCGVVSSSSRKAIKDLVRLPHLDVLKFLDVYDAHFLQHNHHEKAFKTALQDDPTTSTGLVAEPFYAICGRFERGWFCRRDVECFRSLHQICAFPLRVTLADGGLISAAVDSYLNTIAAQRSQRRTCGTELNSVIRAWFPQQWEPSNGTFRPHHGPGVTCTTGRAILEKNRAISDVSPLLDYYVRSRDLKSWFPSSLAFMQGRGQEYRPRVTKDLSTKIIFVPKSWKKKRTISAEPASNLYTQQGIRDAMMGFLYHPQPWERALISRSTNKRVHPLARRHRPEDQGPNRDLAFEGSIDGSFATIDLSAASDSVTLTLIRNSFAHTGILPALLCCRTPMASFPDGRVTDLTAYGPMGNALTFPLETIVFCACCEVAIQSTGDSSDDSRYVVYGDDIVIETKYVDPLLAVLSSLDFTVNASKSFWHPRNRFRESCGAEWMDGVDVTPRRISRGFKSLRFSRHDPGCYECNCELANSLFCFPYARRYVIDNLFASVDKRAVPFSPDGEFGLFSSSCTNYQLEWNDCSSLSLSSPFWWAGLQRPVAKIWTAQRKPAIDASLICDEEHLFNWYCTHPDTARPPLWWEERSFREWVPMVPTRLGRKYTAALYPTCST